LSLKKIKTLPEEYSYWHDNVLISKTDIRSAMDNSIEYHFSEIKEVNDYVAIVTDVDGIFQGLFVNDKLAYPTAYHSIEQVNGEDSLILRKAASEETIIVLENGKVIPLPDKSTPDTSDASGGSSSTTPPTVASTISDSALSNFNITGAWKQTYGEYGWESSNGRIIFFNNNQSNIFSPQDTYGISGRGNGGFTLSVTGLLGGNFTYWVKVIDNNKIEVFKSDKTTLAFKFSRQE